MDVRGPDGKVVRFPDGTDAGKIHEVMSSIYAPQSAPKAHSPGLASELARQVGLTARYIPEGLAQLGGIVANPLNTLVNKGLETVGSNYRLGTDLAASTSRQIDRTGLPKPRNAMERVVGDASRAVVSTAPFVGAGLVAKTAAQPVTRAVGSLLASSPASQAGYAALSGGSTSVAKELNLPPVLQVAAGLGIPMLAAGGIAGAKGAINAIRTPQTAKAAVTARGAITQAMADDAINPQQAGQAIEDANARGVPLSLSDLGDNLRGMAGSLSRKPGVSRTLVRDMVDTRQAAQGDRIRNAITRDLGDVINPYTQSDALMAKAATDSSPLYEDAFAGGSVAPLENQFQDVFQQSSSKVAQAQKALSDAQNALTQSKAGVSRAGENVYANSAALRADRNAAANLKAAETNLANATAEHASHIERLRAAQADGTANAPGAVWSPRIQQFLDHPIMKGGLQRGLTIQSLESVADGIPFNPSEYAVTGVDEAGNHIVGSVPNMRLLDAGKRGLDQIVTDNTDPITGKMNEYGRAVHLFRKAYLKELDSANPTYGQARAAYAGPASARQALEVGRKALNYSDQQIERATARLNDSDRQQFAVGFRSALSDALDRAVDGADKVGRLLGNPRKRKALAAVFGGEDGLNRFLQTMADERMANETYRAVRTGSPTAERIMDDQGNALEQGAQALYNVGTGNKAGLIRQGIGLYKDFRRFGAGQAAQRAREQAAALLTETDPNAIRQATREALRQQLARQALIAQQRRNIVTTGIASAATARRK